MISNKKLFVTGGAGFIGTKLIERLIDENKIFIYDNFWRDALKNSPILKHKNLKVIKGDILDFDNLRRVIIDIKPNIVVHLSAIAGIDTVMKYPVKTMQVNLVGTYNLLEAIKDIEIDRFLNFSTSEIFGNYAYKVDDDAQSSLSTVGETRWSYSVSKLAGEHLCYSYAREYKIPLVNVRPFNVYGPGQVGEGAVHKFVVNALLNKDIEIHGDGDQIRSWCYIDDFIDGIFLCIEKEEAIGQSFNIGNPRGTTTILMLARLVKELAKSMSRIVHVPKTYVDVELRIPNIDKARKLLGYNPKIDLEEGLIKTIEWYREVLKND